MGLVKWFINKFSCKSSCMFNPVNEIMDFDKHKLSLESFNLKHKDIIKIHKILNKRQIKNKLNYI